MELEVGALVCGIDNEWKNEMHNAHTRMLTCAAYVQWVLFNIKMNYKNERGNEKQQLM